MGVKDVFLIYSIFVNCLHPAIQAAEIDPDGIWDYGYQPPNPNDNNMDNLRALKYFQRNDLYEHREPKYFNRDTNTVGCVERFHLNC
jgi:hypothetical protein